MAAHASAQARLRENGVACLAVAILAERQPDVYDIERTPLFALVDELRAVVAGTSDCGAACAEAARWLCDCQVEACVALAQSGTRQWLHLEPDATGTPKGTCPEYVRCRCSSNGPVQYASIGAVKALEFKHSKSGSSSTVLLTSNWSSPTSVADAAALYRRTSSAPVPAVAVVPVPAVAVVPVPAVAVVPVAAVPVLEATPQSHRRRAEEPAVVYAVRCFDDGASAGARARAGARAGTSAGASAGGAAADVHVQLHGLQTAKALEGWQRPVVRTRVMAVLLRQLFLEGAFAHGTPLWYIQRVYLEVHRRVDSFTGMTRKFCRRLRAAASARTACVVERAVCGMASSLRQLSTTSPNLDGCADRADRERRVHACALAGTLLNVLRDLPVSGHLGTEPTIVDMIMLHAVLRPRTERDRDNVARPCLQFARLTAGQGPVPMALPTFFYETLNPAKHEWQQDKSGPWCTLAYEQVLQDGWWRMRPVFVQGQANGSRTVTVGAISPRTNASMAPVQHARTVHVHTLVRSALTEVASVRAGEAADCATDAILQWYYTETGQLVSMRYMCKHLSVPGTRCWARVTTVKEGDSPMVGTLPDGPFGGVDPRYGFTTTLQQHKLRNTDYRAVRVTYHEPRSRDDRQVVHWRPCIVLHRTTTDVDVPVQLGGAPTMGNLAERFAVLVLVPLVDEDQEPQQFFAGQRYDVNGVSAVQAWKVIPGAASAASSKSRGKKRKGGGQSQGQPPDRAPERRSAEEMAEPPEYAMNPQTPRGVRHRNGGPADSSQGGTYFPHTETSAANTRSLLAGHLDPGVVFAHYFAERTDLSPRDFRLARLDMSPRDFWAPATVRAQQEARRQHANLGLWPLRLAGGQVSSTAGKYYMLSNVCELVRKGNDNPLPKCLPSDDDDGGGGRGPAHGAPHDASTADDAFAELADAPPLARARRTYSATGRDSGGGGSGGGGSGGGGASQPNADGVAEWLPLAQGPAGGANASRAAFTLLDLGSVPSNDNFLFDFALGGSGDDDGNDQDGPRGIDGDGLPGIDGHGLPGIDGDGLHGTDGDGLHGTDGDGQHGLHDDSDEDGQDGLVSSDDEGDAAVQRFLGNSKKL